MLGGTAVHGEDMPTPHRKAVTWSSDQNYIQQSSVESLTRPGRDGKEEGNDMEPTDLWVPCCTGEQSMGLTKGFIEDCFVFF